MSLSLLAGLLYVLGFVPYIISIIRGETKPSKATWVIWSVLDMIALAGMINQGTVSGTMVAGTLGATTVAILALIKGRNGWTTIDVTCLVGAVVGMGMLFLNPEHAIVVSMIAMLIGTIPTWQSALQNPQDESRVGWSIFAVGCIVGVMAMSEWSMSGALQPCVYLLIDGTIAAIVWFKK